MGTFNRYCLEQTPYQRFGGKHVQELMVDICKGAAYLHSCEVIHGDLTSNNVLLKSTGKNLQDFCCKVCDFGLASWRSLCENAIQGACLGGRDDHLNDLTAGYGVAHAAGASEA